MDIDSYIKSTYTIERYFGQKQNIMLIRSKIDKKQYVLKCIKVYERAIYDILKEHEIDGVPKIYELMETPEKVYIIESYIEGNNLDDFLQKDIPDYRRRIPLLWEHHTLLLLNNMELVKAIAELIFMV